MTNPIQYPSIPTPLLAFLLDQTGDASEMSPRHLWSKVTMPNPRQAQELFDTEITSSPVARAALTPRFSRIAHTLMNPQTNLTFRAWGGSDSAIETNVQFPGYIREGNGVALNQIDGTFQISAFFDESHIFDQLAPLLSVVNDSIKPIVFEAHLPLSVATTLFALLDLYRGAEYHSAPYTSVEINAYIQDNWGLTGFDELLSFLLALGNAPAPLTQPEVESSLAMLTDMEFLKKTDDSSYELGTTLLPLVGLSRGNLPGIQWQHLSSDDNGDLLITNRTWLYGNNGLILMLAPMGEDRIFISSVNVESMKQFLVDELTGPIAVSTEDHSPPLDATYDKIPPHQEEKQKEEIRTTIRKCLVCGAELKPGAKFCTGCGAPVPKEEESPPTPAEPEQKIRKCPVCGAELPPGAKFCTSCGASVPTQEKAAAKKPIPQIPKCPKCGAELKPGAKFCTSCGAAVQDQKMPAATRKKPVPKENVCPKCSAKLKPGVKFCTHCGAKIAAD